jgi:transcriptional regulator with XRE-family HTH domain
METTLEFIKWFKPLMESSGLKQRVIAARAGIHPVSLSRIMSGNHGVDPDTALALVEAVNGLVGRELASVREAKIILAGLSEDEDDGLFKGLEKLSPDNQRLARRQIKAIIDSLAEQEHEFDYIEE